MCDYSLEQIPNRPARVGESLISAIFPMTTTRGFASVNDRNTAVCLLPGTELVFENDVQYERLMDFLPSVVVRGKEAVFRQLNMNIVHTYHDALEFPNGQIAFVTRLTPGQIVTVRQIPVIQAA